MERILQEQIEEQDYQLDDLDDLEDLEEQTIFSPWDYCFLPGSLFLHCYPGTA